MSTQTIALDTLVGAFRGIDQIHASVWAGAEDANASAEGTFDLGGGLVVLRLDETRESGSFTVLHLFMADPATGEVLLYAFDSLGCPPDPPARGSWVDGELVLERSTERGDSRTGFAPYDGGFRWWKQFRAPAGEEWQDVVHGDLRRFEIAGAA